MCLKQVLFWMVALGATAAVSQQGPWAQCGGTGWTGGTSCVNGYSCVYSNEWYSQCIPGTSTATTTKANPTTTKAGTTSSKTATATNGQPTLFLCGDSTMAKNGAGDGYTDGWGPYVPTYVTIPVVNNAIGGRSARSFTREGRFASVLAAAKAGDWVIIEFGHNDGGSLTPTDNGRTPCPGSAEETCKTVYNGVSETVLTFYAYLRNAAKAFEAKGIHVIVSSATPNNLWETGTWSYSATRFSTMAKSAAGATNSVFVDHGWFVADRYKTLGATAVNAYYPKDHTHTSPAGAKTVAETFFRGLQCGSAGLKTWLSAAGKAVPGQTCGGI